MKNVITQLFPAATDQVSQDGILTDILTTVEPC